MQVALDKDTHYTTFLEHDGVATDFEHKRYNPHLSLKWNALNREVFPARLTGAEPESESDSKAESDSEARQVLRQMSLRPTQC